MTGSNKAGAPRIRRWTWAALAVVVVAAVGAVIAVGASGSPPSGSASAPTMSPSAPSPGSSESPTSTGAAPGEDGSGDAATDPGEASPGQRATSEPVPLDQEAKPAPDVTVSLASLDAIEGQASVPGEVAGPALRVTVEVRNDGAAPLPTGTLVVNLSYGPDRTPANILVTPRENLPDEIAPGDSAQGVFAFSVPMDARGDLVVEIDVDVDSAIVLFAGGI